MLSDQYRLCYTMPLIERGALRVKLIIGVTDQSPRLHIPTYRRRRFRSRGVSSAP